MKTKETYEMVSQWASGLNANKAFDEITGLKLKYPWLKCDESLKFIEMMKKDLPSIVKIIRLQEMQNTYSELLINVNGYADEAIVKAAAVRLNISLDEL